jgi:hypothetical protein
VDVFLDVFAAVSSVDVFLDVFAAVSSDVFVDVFRMAARANFNSAFGSAAFMTQS